MTTDSSPKRCCVSAGGVTVSAQAKGAGMIEPGYATMLCFVQTDAVVADPDATLRAAVAGSFERITVDGQMSTNDTVLLQASGAGGGPLPAGLLEAVLLQLALEIVADGEGASRVGRIEVRGAAGDDEAERVARAIANSPLVKTALYGRDPNWGRIAQAAGQALAGAELPELGPDRIDAARDRGRDRRAGADDRARARLRSRIVYFSDLDPRIHQDQRGVPDVTDRMSAEERAAAAAGSVATLLEALPYIREFHGRTVVIKYGGAAMRDPAIRDEFARDVVLLKYVGLKPVIVHGGGPDISHYMERLGLEVEFVEGLRVSDAETVEVAKMVLLGKVNSDIVQRLNRLGQPAIGLSGEDGAMFEIASGRRIRPGRLRRRDRERRRRRPQPRRLRLHPGDRRRRLRPRGQLLQRQRRQRGRQGGGGAARLQGDLPHRRRRLARGPRRSLTLISLASVAEVEAAIPAIERRYAAEARGLRRGDPRWCAVGAHPRRPPSSHACSSSSSPTPASARR